MSEREYDTPPVNAVAVDVSKVHQQLLLPSLL